MGVENDPLGGGINAAVSVGPAVSISPALTALAGLNRFGMEVAPLLPINEGPVARSFLEESMPLTKGEIKFNSLIGPSVPVVPTAPDVEGEFKHVEALQSTEPWVTNTALELNPTQAVQEAEVKVAEEWLAVTRPKVEPSVTPVAGFRIVPLSVPQVEPEIIPISKSLESTKPQLVVSPALGAQEGTHLVIPATAPQIEPATEEVEEIIEQVTQAEEETGSEEAEDTEIAKTKIVESVITSQERRKEILAAVKKALKLGITIKEALSDRFMKLTSPLVKGRKDWTIDLTADELNVNPASYTTVEQLQKLAIVAVANNIPVEEGEGSRQATVGEVRKVIRGEDDKLKPRIPAEIVRVRTVKKKKAAKKAGQSWFVEEDRIESAQENTLEGLKLKEVFQKAA